MYDELVKRLRNCTAELNGEKTLWCQAADAIEELSKCLDGVCADNESLCNRIQELNKKYLDSEVDNTNLTGWLAEEHAKHLWIPVTERLPENGVTVLAYYNNFMTEAFYANNQWHELATYAIIPTTYWMQRPEPPKEET